MTTHRPAQKGATDKPGILTSLHAMLYLITITAPVWMVGIFWYRVSHQETGWAAHEPSQLHWDDFFSYWGLGTPDQWMGAALWVVTITITWNLQMYLRRKIAEMPEEEE